MQTTTELILLASSGTTSNNKVQPHDHPNSTSQQKVRVIYDDYNEFPSKNLSLRTGIKSPLCKPPAAVSRFRMLCNLCARPKKRRNASQQPCVRATETLKAEKSRTMRSRQKSGGCKCLQCPRYTDTLWTRGKNQRLAERRVEMKCAMPPSQAIRGFGVVCSRFP